MAAIYLLCGDNFLKEKEILKLKAEVLKSESTVLNYETYEALAEDFSLLEESLRSPSLSGKKLVLIEKADKFDSNQLEKILSLSAKNEALTLILTSDKRDFAAQFPAAYKVNTKILDRIYADKVPVWLMQRAKEKGTSVSVDAAEALAENLGDNLKLLDLSLDVLINFVNKERRIEKRDVEQLVVGNLNENVFALADAAAERNTELALKLADSFLTTEYEAQQILGVLTWHFTRLLTAKKIIERYDRVQGQDRLQKMFSLKRFPLEKLVRQANNFTCEQLEGAIRELFAADVRIKTLMTKPRYILETAIINLCGG